jgi:hypothetical protein
MLFNFLAGQQPTVPQIMACKNSGQPERDYRVTNDVARGCMNAPESHFAKCGGFLLPDFHRFMLYVPGRCPLTRIRC